MKNNKNIELFEKHPPFIDKDGNLTKLGTIALSFLTIEITKRVLEYAKEKEVCK